jgi:hypothetical protein
VHGCRGRAAHVGTVSARAQRQAFGPCRACQATIFLDERAALCRACDSAHHPQCLEQRGSCAKCGSRDASLMAATEFARYSAEARRSNARSSMPAVLTGVVLLAASAAAALFGSGEIALLLLVCAVAEFVLGLIVLTRTATIAKLLIPDREDGSSGGRAR